MKKVNVFKLSKVMGQAISGEEKALFEVIELFMENIVVNSFYNGEFREDLKIEIINKLYNNIPKFDVYKFKK